MAGVLDALLGEDFNPGEMRDAMGRWVRGATSERHGAFKIGDAVTYETGSREAGGHGPVTFTKQPGAREVVGFQRNGYLRLREPKSGTTVDVHHTHATKIGPLHPDYRGAIVQQDYVRDRERIAREKAARARPRRAGALDEVVNFGGVPTKKGDVIAQLQREGHPQAYIDRYLQGLDRGRKARESAPVALGALLEGFAAPQADPFPDHAFTTGDQVRVSVGNGAKAVVGRVMRPHGQPPTHAVISPEGGGAHVLAPVGQVKLNTPAQHAAASKRQERENAKQEQSKATAAWMAAKPPGVKPPGPVREAFAPSGANIKETPAQSQRLGAAQVAAAKSWNANQHPRGAGGKFSYSTGGKRGTRSSASSGRYLGTGSSGALVKSVQRQLHVSTDGQYGQQTRAAVERYQRQHGLRIDGVIGRQTLAALRGHPKPATVSPGPISSRAARLRTHPSARPKAPIRISGGQLV